MKNALVNFTVIGNIASIRTLDGTAHDELVGGNKGTKVFMTLMSNSAGSDAIVNDVEGWIPDRLVVRKGDLVAVSGTPQKVVSKDKQSSRTCLDFDTITVGFYSKQRRDDNDGDTTVESQIDTEMQI